MRFFISIILLAFSCYTAWIAWTFGYSSVFTESFRSHPSTQALIDLFIASGILTFIMVVDNHRKGRSFFKLIPFLLVTLLFASIGPLLYFLIYPDLLLLRRQTAPQRDENHPKP